MTSLLVCSCLLLALQFRVIMGRPQSSDPTPAQAAPAAQPISQLQEHNQGSSTPIPIVSQTEIINPDGSFNYSYETGNGIKVAENSTLKKVPSLASRNGNLGPNDTSEEYILVQQGSYSYTAPDGQVISLRYLADENGFQPEGDHLPTTPAIPEAIKQSLGQIQNTTTESEPPQPQAQPTHNEPAVEAQTQPQEE